MKLSDFHQLILILAAGALNISLLTERKQAGGLAGTSRGRAAGQR